MSGLAAARCLNHEAREAVSQCPSCKNYFCRECVTIFEDRITCARCLKALSEQNPNAQHNGFGVSGVALALAGFLSAWFVFYAAAWIVLEFRDRVPTL